MKEKYSIPLSQLAKEFSLEEICVPADYENILVTTPEVSRPGLAVAGFFEVFDEDRLQLIGYAEHRYLSGLTDAERRKRISDFVNAKPVGIIVTTGQMVFDEMVEVATQVGVPILRTAEHTSPHTSTYSTRCLV